ncbi:MAG: DUF2270 domain-containing protein [Planctomycetota bacterium]|nr:DUF2270 domain-containing protein [Planctomycetota bacterium]
MNNADPTETSVDDPGGESALLQRFPASNLQVLAHFYRGELSRANVWRQRMDATTHWAVITTMAVVSLAYSSKDASILLMPFCCMLLYLLLHIEARRYRYFDVWRMRVRMLEVHLMVPALLREEQLVEGNWREMLCNDLLAPNYKMSRFEALGRRLQRTYIWLFLIVLGSWLMLAWERADVQAVGEPESYNKILLQAFDAGSIPPQYLLLGMALFYLYLLLILLKTGPTRATEIRRKDPKLPNWPI